MPKTINVTKTVTLATDVFLHIIERIGGTDTSFSEALNDLCHEGMEVRKAQEPQEQPAAGGSEDGGE